MKISYNWLREYIDFEESPEEISRILTDLGLEVGGLEEQQSVKGGLAGLVLGEVLSCEQHPNADRLKKTLVDVGGDQPLNIVCGAPNVAEGQTVVVATVGTTLYSGEESFKIKKSKIRGELSEGMLCSEVEIGLGEDNSGILVLPDGAQKGVSAAQHFNIESDYIIEIDITPNRADGLSYLGVARDLAAYFNVHVSERKVKAPTFSALNKGSDEINIEVTSKEACPKYGGVLIQGVKIEPSPSWLSNKLLLNGLKPINNVVDITNYILLEYGQPLHAFDLSKIEGGINVRFANQGEKLELLDGQVLELASEDLLIADDAKALCLAGVMGGAFSGVSDTTTDILLEGAYFDPVTVRKSSKRHGVKTDSSYRFERGVDPNNTENALARAVALIEELCGGKAKGLKIEQSKEFHPFEVEFDTEKNNKLLGTSFSTEEVKKILNALEISIKEENGNKLHLEVPQYRVDVTRACDVSEEILRVHGYNNVEIPTQLNASLVYEDRLPSEVFQTTLSDLLTSNGFNEILNNSLSQADYTASSITFPAAENVEMLNPLSRDLAIMRRHLLFGGLESIARNQNMKNPDLKLYEFGKVYWKQEGEYKEEKKLSLLISGAREKSHWNSNVDLKSNFFTLKGYLNLILDKSGVDKLKFKAAESEFLADCQTIYSKKVQLGTIGVVSKSELKKFGIKQEVYYCELNWDALLQLARNKKVRYQELNKFHPVKRDFSLLLDEKTSFKELESIAFEADRKFLKEVELFDVYQGDKLPEGKKSYALSFKLQGEDETLNEKQIDKVMSRLSSQFEQKLGASLR